MSRDGFHTITLGCKLNQFDSSAIEGELVQRGFAREPDADRAAVVVINTCTVTHRADADARRLIRRVRRRNPNCRLLVTGCYAERSREAIERIGGIDRVFGNREKRDLPTILDALDIGRRPARPGSAAPGPTDRGCDAALGLPGALSFGERSRAFLRIQEGCRLSCSYCIIPEVRGPSRSVRPDEVVRGLQSVLLAGYREVVLTGVNTGDYGRDLAPRTDLAALLRRLLTALGPNRIRLNSLEPLTIGDELIELLAGDPRLAPHLQVPLQSGSEEILRAMGRNYRFATYLERLERLRDRVPGIGLGADVIVGFPGETDRRFRESYDRIAASPLNYLHVFSWSPRPGTPAAGLPDRVEGQVLRERTEELRALGRALSLRFRRRLLGRRLDAIALAPAGGERPTRALTGNFIEVELSRGTARRREPITVRIESVDGETTRGRVEGLPAWAEGPSIGRPDTICS